MDVKVAEMAGNTYREVARILSEWTAVSISHTTVGNIEEGQEAQKEADEELVKELEESAELPRRKEVDFLYLKDGVFVSRTEKKKSHEVSTIIYEGGKNGDRVSLVSPKVIMTTEPTDRFWKEVQAFTARMFLEKTQS